MCICDKSLLLLHYYDVYRLRLHISSLFCPQLGVDAFLSQKLRVRSTLLDFPLRQDENYVRILDCAQSVGDRDRRTTFLSLFQGLLYNL